MTFPSIAQTTEGTGSGQSAIVTMPAGTGGIVIVLLTVQAGSTSSAVLSGEGWVKLGQSIQGQPNLSVFAKQSTGSDALTVRTDTFGAPAYRWEAIRVAGGVSATASFTRGDGPNPDPPNHNAVGAQDYLWIAAAASSDTTGVSAAPSGYAGLVARTTAAALYYASLQLNTASENPGVFTRGGTSWSAATISVAPGGDITPPEPPSGAGYYKIATISAATGAGAGYPVRLTVNNGTGTDGGSTIYLNGKGRSDFADLRFRTDDLNTALSFWIEEIVGNVATVWVRVAADLTSTSRMVAVFYGDAANTATTSNGEATFDFFDDFSGAALNAAKWTKFGSATITQTGGLLSASSSGDPNKLIATSAPQGDNYAVRARFRLKNGAAADNRIGVGLKTATATGLGYNWLFRNFNTKVDRQFLNDAIAWGNNFPAAWVLNSWYVAEAYQVGTNLFGRFNDGTWNSWASGNSRTGFPALNLGGFQETTTSDWDYALVRRMTSPEPTVSNWSAEVSLTNTRKLTRHSSWL